MKCRRDTAAHTNCAVFLSAASSLRSRCCSPSTWTSCRWTRERTGELTAAGLALVLVGVGQVRLVQVLNVIIWRKLVLLALWRTQLSLRCGLWITAEPILVQALVVGQMVSHSRRVYGPLSNCKVFKSSLSSSTTCWQLAWGVCGALCSSQSRRRCSFSLVSSHAALPCCYGLVSPGSTLGWMCWALPSWKSGWCFECFPFVNHL